MATNDPKRHHYIPEMLLRNFCNAQGLLWVNSGEKIFKITPKNIFVEGHLYTKSDFSASPKGAQYEDFLNAVNRTFEYEKQLSDIEASAKPSIEKIIEQARQGLPPQLSGDEQESWNRFIIATARRTPESQDRVSSSRNRIDPFYEAVSKVASINNYSLPSKDVLYKDPRVLQLREMVMSNSDAKFAAEDDPRLRAETARFSRDMGLCVFIIRIPERSFVIGSHGLTIVDPEVMGNKSTISFLPIAHDIAVNPTVFPHTESLVFLDPDGDGERMISTINRAATAGSKIIAGLSEDVVRHLSESYI